MTKKAKKSKTVAVEQEVDGWEQVFLKAQYHEMVIGDSSDSPILLALNVKYGITVRCPFNRMGEMSEKDEVGKKSAVCVCNHDCR